MAEYQFSRFLTDYRNLSFYKTNRCYIDNVESAKKAGFSEKECIAFKGRLKEMIDSMKKNGVLNSDLTIYRYQGNNYIVDGQTRIVALTYINKEREKKGLTKLKIRASFYNASNEDEIRRDLYELNKVQKPWGALEILKANAIASNNEVVKRNEAFLRLEVIDKLKCSATAACRIMYDKDYSKHIDLSKEYWHDSSNFINYMLDLKEHFKNEAWTNKDISNLCSTGGVKLFKKIYIILDSETVEIKKIFNELLKNAIGSLSSSDRRLLGDKNCTTLKIKLSDKFKELLKKSRANKIKTNKELLYTLEAKCFS